MNFKNTSRTQSIENAVIKVSAVTNDAGAGAAFTPANSSSTFYIESIAPGQTAQEKITLLPKADAAPNSYSMQVSFDYVYGKDHTAANDTVTFSIPVSYTHLDVYKRQVFAERMRQIVFVQLAYLREMIQRERMPEVRVDVPLDCGACLLYTSRCV